MVKDGHNNPPHAILELDEGMAEHMEIFLLQRRSQSEKDFHMAQAQMIHAAGDVELCTQLLMKLRGESTEGRYQFKTTAQKLQELREQDNGTQEG